jgi:hypothetical protein
MQASSRFSLLDKPAVAPARIEGCVRSARVQLVGVVSLAPLDLTYGLGDVERGDGRGNLISSLASFWGGFFAVRLSRGDDTCC